MFWLAFYTILDIPSHFFDGENYGYGVAKPKNNGLLRKKTPKGWLWGKKEQE